MAISDKTFAEHAKWLAFERNRFSWPKHWQVVIFKVHKQYDDIYDIDRYVVLPANPEFQVYIASDPLTPEGKAFTEPPPMHLGPVEFDSMEDIDQWAKVAHRLR